MLPEDQSEVTRELSTPLRRPPPQRLEVKKLKNDAMHMLGNDLSKL